MAIYIYIITRVQNKPNKIEKSTSHQLHITPSSGLSHSQTLKILIRSKSSYNLIMPSTSSQSPPFLGAEEDMSLLQGGGIDHPAKYDETGYDSYPTEAEVEEAKEGKPIDPRLLMLLEFFRQLYIRRREVFKKIFPGLQDGFAEALKKVGAVVLSPQSSDEHTIKARTLQRSLSVGSPRSIGGEPPLRLERFRVRTVFPGGVGPQGGGQDHDKDGSDSGGSTSK